jgi:hypothetical protein
VVSSQTDGFYKVHAWTDHLAASTGQGHLSHINEWIRKRPAAWQSGVVLTPSVAEGVSAALIDLSYTSGIIYQLHEHVFDEFDSSIANEEFYVLNDPITPYKHISNLNSTDLSLDAAGGSLTNKFYNIVIWGVVSEDLEDCQVYINLPIGSYNTSSGALADIDVTASYSLPVEYTGTAFLMTRLVMRNLAGNIEIITGGEFDLRGTIPSATGGGVTGGTGITLYTQLLDTDNAYTGFAGLSPVVNAGETGLEFNETLAESISQDAAPATATTTGVKGQIRFDSGFLYICTATDVWVRTPLSTWV